MNTILFFCLFFFSFNLTAQHEHVYEGPLGDEWVVQSQITIPEGKIIKLKSPVSIVADKLIIAGELVTDGNILNIEAREIEFKAGGKITGFNTTPSPITFVDNTLMNITHNNTCSWNGTDDWAIGRNGPTGLPGIDGNPSPGKISLLAGLLTGEVDINADGQQGGQGGQGGHGGKGVNGCKGSPGKAEAFCIGKPKIIEAGRGGNGAMGGLGGIGGTGGAGGTNISLEIVQLKQQIPDNWKTSNLGGKGGQGGLPGVNGLSGDRGAGGDGHRDKAECLVQVWPIKVTKIKVAEVGRGIDGGQVLRVESEESRNRRYGSEGQKCSASEDKRIFTSSVLIYEQQFIVTKTAYEFHWRRLFNLLLNDSLRIALNSARNREAFSKLDNGELKKHLKKVNLHSLEKITQYWQEFFIDRQTAQLNSNNLTREQKLPIEKRLELAKTMANIHQQLTSDQANLDNIIQQIRFIQDESAAYMRLGFTDLRMSCHAYLSAINENFSNKIPSPQFTIPVCHDIAKFESDSFLDLVLAVPLKAAIEGEYDGDVLSVKKITKNGREISGDEEGVEIILINGRRFRKKDFALAKPQLYGELNENGRLKGYKVYQESSINIDTLKFYILGLEKGCLL